MKHVAIDMDEVLANTIESLLQHHNYILNGVACTKDMLKDYHLAKNPSLKLTDDEAIKLFSDFLHQATYHDIMPVAGAKEKLIAMKEHNYTISIVTARQDDLRKPTANWLSHYFNGLYDNIVLCNYNGGGNKRDKGDVCVDIKADAIVEDNLSYATEITAKGIKTYLLDRPRNQHYCQDTHHNVYKINGREDLDIDTI